MKFEELKDDRLDAVKEIYEEAFPKKERKPFRSIKKTLKKGTAKIYTVCEDGNVMGFAMTIPHKNNVLVDYLAVSHQFRDRGTGTFLLKELERELQGKKIALLIERPDEMSINAEQRISRRKFYLRNGFVSDDVFVTGKSGDMEVMEHGGKVSGEEFLELMRCSLGNRMFKISGMRIAEG